MAQIAGRLISRVKIVDDDPFVRQGYEYALEELDIEAISAEGPLPPAEQFVEETSRDAHAILCDFHLKKGRYALFNGAEPVAALYQRGFPSVLCTKWEDASIDEMRVFRRFIPALIKPDELDPDTLVAGLEACIQEIEGRYLPTRRPWRTIVRVEEFDTHELPSFFFVVVPAWDPNEVVRLRTSDIPTAIRDQLAPGNRYHASVNLGAYGHEELYFFDWETIR